MSSDLAELNKDASLSAPPRQRPKATDDPSPQKAIRILHRATEQFLDRGFAGANLDQIALAAGVGKAAIYHLFGDKAELFAQCLQAAVCIHSGRLRGLLHPDLPVEQVLADYAEQHIIRMFYPVCGSRPYYEFARVLLSASITHPELSRRCLTVLREQEGSALETYFREKVSQRVLAGEPVFLMEHFLQIIFFTTHVILDPIHAEDYRDVRFRAEQTVHLFLHGCVSKTSS